MTAAALTRVVIGRQILDVAALAIVRRDVVKLDLAKTLGIVAQLARRSHPPAVRIVVTGRTLALGSLIDAFDVTALTFRCCVSAQQGKAVVL
jgi:hypothetical protein